MPAKVGSLQKKWVADENQQGALKLEEAGRRLAAASNALWASTAPLGAKIEHAAALAEDAARKFGLDSAQSLDCFRSSGKSSFGSDALSGTQHRIQVILFALFCFGAQWPKPSIDRGLQLAAAGPCFRLYTPRLA